MSRTSIALVGDFSPDVVAHRAIDQCFALARTSMANPVASQWLNTDTIISGDKDALIVFQGIWLVPASPYRNTEGALWAIQYARTHSMPFLGTCGGYQHALLEYARNVLGLEDSGHAELEPAAPLPLLDRMQCPLIEQSQAVIVTDHGFQSIYGAASGLETFHCSYGLNPDYEAAFAGSSLRIVARSAAGHARAFHLQGHPFFVGTQFQPERQAFSNSIHPLVQVFFSVAGAFVRPLSESHSGPKSF